MSASGACTVHTARNCLFKIFDYVIFNSISSINLLVFGLSLFHRFTVPGPVYLLTYSHTRTNLGTCRIAATNGNKRRAIFLFIYEERSGMGEHAACGARE